MITALQELSFWRFLILVAAVLALATLVAMLAVDGSIDAQRLEEDIFVFASGTATGGGVVSRLKKGDRWNGRERRTRR